MPDTSFFTIAWTTCGCFFLYLTLLGWAIYYSVLYTANQQEISTFQPTFCMIPSNGSYRTDTVTCGKGATCYVITCCYLVQLPGDPNLEIFWMRSQSGYFTSISNALPFVQLYCPPGNRTCWVKLSDPYGFNSADISNVRLTDPDTSPYISFVIGLWTPSIIVLLIFFGVGCAFFNKNKGDCSRYWRNTRGSCCYLCDRRHMRANKSVPDSNISKAVEAGSSSNSEELQPVQLPSIISTAFPTIPQSNTNITNVDYAQAAIVAPKQNTANLDNVVVVPGGVGNETSESGSKSVTSEEGAKEDE